MTPIRALPTLKHIGAAMAAIACLVLLPVQAEAQLTLTNLASFSVFPNGANPEAALVRGNDGNFYGTTPVGGSNSTGTIFKVTTNGVVTTLHAFTGSVDGKNPQAGLVLGTDGNFYGTTAGGGTKGDGTVFKITTNNVFTSLHSFTNRSDGAVPKAALVQGSDGNFYGTTSTGGTNSFETNGVSFGTVFKITTNGMLTTLYDFTNRSDGEVPKAALVQGSDGNFYGTTSLGGTNSAETNGVSFGTVFKITTNGTLTTVYDFTNKSNGEVPEAALVQGSNGNFYGTTSIGGDYGAGTVFSVTTNGALTSFSLFGGIDGSHPVAALVKNTNNGSFYGTTEDGGTNGGNGTVFQITTNGTLTILYSFTGGNDGAYPKAALAQGSDGNYYGMAASGGMGNGTVFRIATNGTFAALYAFPGLNDGQAASALVHGGDGKYYGTTQYGGANGDNGTVFKITTNGPLINLYSFTGGDDGANPLAGLVQGSDGNFYGTASAGGVFGEGSIFEITPDGTPTILYSFMGASDGSYPNSALVPGRDGNFFGTTSVGDGQNGTIFKVSTNGDLDTLYSFTGELDGTQPNGVVRGVDGNFYGTTSDGGTNSSGAFFMMTAGGSLTVLYSFTGGNDGGFPLTSLVQGGDGNFYGTTSQGGAGAGNGTVFQITPNGALATLYSFNGDTDGDSPSGLLAGTDGNFYATTADGGTNGDGAIFKLTPGGMLTNLYSFTNGADGGSPSTSLVQGGDGSFFGTTASGADGGFGGIFHLSGGGLPSPLPVITIQPVNPLLIETGLPATLSVDTLGGTPFRYQWYQNGVALSAAGDFSGVHLGTLTVDPVSTNDAGTYSVAVSNSYGATTSSNAVLTFFTATNAMEDFAAGTNYEAVGDFALASFYLSNALNSSPMDATNSAYNFFYAVSELLSLPEEPAGSNFLTHIGFGSAGRDIFNWQADKPTNANGHLEIPSNSPTLNVDEFTAQLRTNVLFAIIGAQSNLAEITDTNFTVDLTTNETHASTVTVDWGDVQMLQAMCDTAELFIYTTYSWNLDVQFASLTNIFAKNSGGGIEELLTNYPSFLTTTTTADLPAAQGAFTNAINEYFAASQFIRNPSRPTDDNPHLFSLDINNTNDVQNELQFRETLSNLLASLTNPPTPLTVAPAYSVSAQALFSGNFDLNSYLPQFQGDDFVWDTFPDTTFGGIINGLTEAQVGKGVRTGGIFKHLETVLDLPDTSLSVLYNFTNFFGQTGVVQGPDGTLYGTLMTGGPYIDFDQIFGVGFGSVFKVTTDGQFSTLHNFGAQQDEFGSPLDGGYPNALIFGNDGNLYGTTQEGGTNNEDEAYNYGTFFEITTNGQLTTLYTFGTEADLYSIDPKAALVQGSNGNFYGTTAAGGSNGYGTIFVVSTNGDLTSLYSFTNGSDGRYPVAAPLVQGPNGNCFYGTTPQGGANGYGTIFKISTNGQFSLLYTFGTIQDGYGDPLDGAVPNGLVLGADGYLYGTTEYGGTNDDNIGLNGGLGYYYDYGNNNGPYGNGDGTIFSLSTDGTFTSLFSFDETFPDGYNPIGSLLPGPYGSFFGVASGGGANSRGSVFIFNPGGPATNVAWLSKPSGSYEGNLQSFSSYESYYNGDVNPVPSLLTMGLDGNLYGTTTDEGANGSGTIYQLALPGLTNAAATLTTPTNGQSFSAPATIFLSATVATLLNGTTVSFYNGTNLLGPGTATASNYTSTVSELPAGTYAFTAVSTSTNGNTNTSAVAYVTVNTPGTVLIDFDPLADLGPVEGDAALSDYLAQDGVSVINNSPGATVAAITVAGSEFVIASSPPNVLTQIGSNGPVSFTVDFATNLSQFSFTRPELVANPSVTLPPWRAQAFDSLGLLLDSTNAPLISSSTNVPAQIYTLTGGSIASVEFSSEGTGYTTFNAMLLDNFVLTPGNSGDLPPSVIITSPTNGQVFTSTPIPISVETAAGSGTVTGVTYYSDGTTPVGTNTSGPFSFSWGAPNGALSLTAVAVNNSSLSSTSAPVSITVATGFAFETQPMSQTIGAGNKATFSVTATESNVTYQWLSNGIAIAGAASSSYTVTNAQTSASYTVVASYDGQPITSSAAVLTVLGPPMISLISGMPNGSNFIMSVVISDVVSNYVQWLLNGTGIAGTTSNYPAGTVTNSYTFANEPFNSGNYEVVVANAVASTNSLPVAVNLGPANITATNDTLASSLTLTNNPATGPPDLPVAGNNSDSPATDGKISTIAGKPAGRFLWYNWTSPSNIFGVISLTTRGSSFDTLLGIYTNNGGTLVSVAEDDDSGGYFTSLLSFNFQSNTTYQIAVAGYNGAAGNVLLELSPTNGYIINATEPVITQQPVNQIVSAGSTVTNIVTADYAAGYQWYFAIVAVTGGNANTLVITNFSTNGVGLYYVQASNAVGSVQSDNAVIEIQNTAQTTGAPTNLAVDKFGDAVDLTGVQTPEHYRPHDGGGDTGGFTLSQSFSTVGATKEEGEPNHAGQPGGASYWYTYSALSVGSLRFDTSNSTFSTILAVYTNNKPNASATFSTLVAVDSAFTTNYLVQGQPSVTVSNTAPTKYYIAVDGYQGASGTAYLNIFSTPNTNAIPITNITPVLAITSPANNFLTTNSTIVVKGTVKGSASVSAVQVAVNTNAFGPATLQLAQAKTFDWETNVTLVPGANLITAQSIIAASTNTDFVSLPVTRTIFYDVTAPSSKIKAPLTLQTTGQGKITGETSSNLLEIGKVFTVRAVPTGNWILTNWTSGTNTNNLSFLSDSASLAFDMSSNLILQANFVTNPFTPVAGVYNGLFYPIDGVSEESSGFFTATIPASSRGAYSAKLMLDGGSYPFSGTFDLSGDAEEILTRPGKTSLTVDLQLDLPATNNQMTGSVSEIATNGWISELMANRAVFNAKSNPATNYAGKYTLIILPGSTTNEPGGYGYATLANSLAGLVSLSGSLADKTAISQSVALSKDGNIPLYVSLYSHKGSLLGWLTLTNNITNQPAQMIVGTNLAWIKTNIPKALYAAGFTNTNVTVLGSLYVPGAGLSVLTNGTLILSNGSLAGALIYSNLTIVDNKLVNPNTAGSSSNQLSGVVTPATGVLTVTFRPTGASADIVAKGVILPYDTPTNAAGWFLDTDQSGYFLLQQ
jgi:uncharacterized repeat protein (TIGR03803 family)